MRKTVPAGSVYYFEIQDGSFQDALDAFNQRPISVSTPNRDLALHT